MAIDIYNTIKWPNEAPAQKSPSKAWCGDPDNVGNEIIYTAEPYEDVEMSECNANVNVSSLDNTSTQSSTWPLLCVEKFMYDPSWIVLYGTANIWRLHICSCNHRKCCLCIELLVLVLQKWAASSAKPVYFFFKLIIIRQHKTNFELSRLFNISETAVVNIWVTWVNFMCIENSNTYISASHIFIWNH